MTRGQVLTLAEAPFVEASRGVGASHGRIMAHHVLPNVVPLLTDKLFELGLLGILMHDTGYLKRTEDMQGTGAKYTLTHVRRSAEFAHDCARLDAKEVGR